MHTHTHTDQPLWTAYRFIMCRWVQIGNKVGHMLVGLTIQVLDQRNDDVKNLLAAVLQLQGTKHSVRPDADRVNTRQHIYMQGHCLMQHWGVVL